MNIPQVESNIPVTVHGRYLTVAGDPRRLLVGFHGYGENADRHLAELVRIPGIADWTTVSVQALHPFYDRKTQEVIANWMTRQDRELAIEDNVGYVRAVVGRLREERGVIERIVFAGFSQGVAMAWRAAAAMPCAGVIALGGDLPPDVAANPAPLPPALIGRGRSDEWYSAAKLEQDVAQLRDRTTVRVVELDGGHEWSAEFRQAAGEFLESLK
jgi:predicted esterase